jgi:folate-binding protein YgfZ
VEAAGGAVHAAWSEDPGPGWVPDPRLPDLGWRSLAYDGPVTASSDDYDRYRLTLGVPDPARDAGESTYPIEADFDLLNGVDFKKGCFIGQETTSRMKRRGAVKTRMLPLTFDGPPPAFGAEVLAGDLRAGQVLTGVEGRAMALLRLDRIAGAALTADGRPVRADPPPWLTI